MSRIAVQYAWRGLEASWLVMLNSNILLDKNFDSDFYSKNRYEFTMLKLYLWRQLCEVLEDNNDLK